MKSYFAIPKTTTFKFIGIVLLYISMSSCVSKFGTIAGNAQITNDNFSVKGIGIGKSETTSLLFLGGNKNNQLAFQAKQNLYKSYPLQKGQALTNMTIDYTISYWILFKTTKAVLTAEIVDFSNPKDTNSYQILSKDGFTLNEKVLILLNDTAAIRSRKPYVYANISKLGIENFTVTTAESSFSKQKTIECDEKFFYKTYGNFIFKDRKFTIDDEINVNIYDSNTQALTKEKYFGKAVGIKGNKVLVYDKYLNTFKEYKVKPY